MLSTLYQAACGGEFWAPKYPLSSIFLPALLSYSNTPGSAGLHRATSVWFPMVFPPWWERWFSLNPCLVAWGMAPASNAQVPTSALGFAQNITWEMGPQHSRSRSIFPVYPLDGSFLSMSWPQWSLTWALGFGLLALMARPIPLALSMSTAQLSPSPHCHEVASAFLKAGVTTLELLVLWKMVLACSSSPRIICWGSEKGLKTNTHLLGLNSDGGQHITRILNRADFRECALGRRAKRTW